MRDSGCHKKIPDFGPGFFMKVWKCGSVEV
jgi:hypothetical protein